MDKKYYPIIGMEIHVQLKTKSGMFCGCKNDPNAKEPNINTCPVCLGLPGALPVANKKAIEWTVKLGLALGCKINTLSKFDRKHYFYPDLPKGYQISQFEEPFCVNGRLTIASENGQERDIRIHRIHLEEDAGKSMHAEAYVSKHETLIDVNRCGVPLLEIVSEPDMHTPDEAYAYLTALKQVLEYAQVGDCDMEKGQMRCDVNVSVRPRGQARLGEKIEIKNLNSVRAVHRSLVYEIERQVEAVSVGERLRQETRRWDDEAGVTRVLRSKEHAHDYRYFPEPDLPPLVLGRGFVERVRAGLPELPAARTRRYERELGLPAHDAAVLAARQRVLDAAYSAHPERFVRKVPVPPPVPTAAWINPPKNHPPEKEPAVQ